MYKIHFFYEYTVWKIRKQSPQKLLKLTDNCLKFTTRNIKKVCLLLCMAQNSWIEDRLSV